MMSFGSRFRVDSHSRRPSGSLRLSVSLRSAPGSRFAGSGVVFASVFFLTMSALSGAVPSLTNLFPAGGKQGTTFPIALGGKVAGERAGVWVAGAGVTISAPDAKGNATATIAPDAATGLRLVRAFNTEGASAARWFSVGVLPEISEKEPNDGIGEGQQIEKHPACVNGVLEKSGDIDGFMIQAEAGRTIVATVEAYALGSPVDAVLNLFDEQGTRIATAHDGRNLDPFLAHKVEKAGKYTIQISGFDHPPRAEVRFTGGPTVVYRISITTEPVVTQFYPAVVPFGVKQQVELRGHNLDKIDPAFEVDGAKLAVGEALQLLQLPKWSIGPVQVLASATIPLVEKEPNNAAPDAMLLGLPFAAGGTISVAGDVDRFAFQAKKGERLLVQVRSKALGMPLDASLRIESSDGKLLASNDDQGDSADPMAAFNAPAEGTYQAVVSDLFGKGGAMHGYVVEIGVERPDIEFSLTSPNAIVLAVFVKDAKPMTHRTARFTLRGETKRGTSLLDESDPIWLTVTPGKPEAAKKTPLPVIGAVPK